MPRRLVDTAEELLALADLRDIVFFEVAALRNEAPDAEVDRDAQHAVQVSVRAGDERIEVRCRLTVDTGQATLVIDAASRFEYREPLTVSPSARAVFVKRVGVMAVYPYLREAAHEAASKLRVDAPLLGLLRGNEVELDEAEDEEGSS